MEFFDSNGDRRGMKRDFYEGGLRAPLIVRWPGKIESGRVGDDITPFQDLMPMLCDLINAKAPKNDGISMLSLLLDSSHSKGLDCIGNSESEEVNRLFWKTNGN